MRKVIIQSFAAQREGSDRWRAVVEIVDAGRPRERFESIADFDDEDKAGDYASAQADAFLARISQRQRPRRVLTLLQGGVGA